MKYCVWQSTWFKWCRSQSIEVYWFIAHWIINTVIYWKNRYPVGPVCNALSQNAWNITFACCLACSSHRPHLDCSILSGEWKWTQIQQLETECRWNLDNTKESTVHSADVETTRAGCVGRRRTNKELAVMLLPQWRLNVLAEEWASWGFMQHKLMGWSHLQGETDKTDTQEEGKIKGKH